jgi:deoxyribose-phosphate aldolase
MIELEKLANMVDHTLLKADATKEGNFVKKQMNTDSKWSRLTLIQ